MLFIYLFFCAVHPGAALGLALCTHSWVAGGDEHVAFNWTLFSPFPDRLIESDPGVGSRRCRRSVAVIKEHDEASSVPLDGHVTVAAAAARLILMTTLLKCGFQMTGGRAAAHQGPKSFDVLLRGGGGGGGAGGSRDYVFASSTMSLITTLR